MNDPQRTMNVLFAMDGSESARQALIYLQNFPLPGDSRLTLLTVVEKEPLSDENSDTFDDGQRAALRKTRQMLEESATEMLEEAASLISPEIDISMQVRFGHPAEEIVQALEAFESDLVVLGSHGFGGVKRFLLGSVSDQVLLYAGCSVLIVRPDADGLDTGVSRLLLAYDDSEHAKHAARFCAALPLESSTEVTVLSVQPLITLFRQDVKQQISWMWLEKKRIAERGLAWVSQELKWSTDKITSVLHESSDVSQEILDVAENMSSDLIVLGDKGTKAITSFLLGSSSRRIAHHAPCSVLLVKKKD